MQTCQIPLRDTIRSVDGACIRSLDKVLADDVYAAFTSLDKVPQRVLCPVEATRKPEDEKWWVVIDDLEIGKGCKIAFAILVLCATEADGPWDDGRN
jgi:hypothetical protein